VNGETRTGVTTMQIDAGLDTGAMLLKAETEIGAEETAVELGRRLASMGAELLVETLAGLGAGTIQAEKQDDAQATWAPLLKKEDGLIDWTAAAQAIHNRVRGLQPWPGAQTKFRGQPLGIWRSQVAETGRTAAAGTVLSVRPLVVACGAGALELLEVQLEGRKRMAAADFANGQRLAENEGLGEGLPS
jgi:methionyl-tRNA formyltransferase